MIRVEGSIYEGMEAALVEGNRTIAHVSRFSDAIAIAEDVNTMRGWKDSCQAIADPFSTVEPPPRDGRAFLAYGVHTDPVAPGAAGGVKPGDDWWAILLWDIWRQPGGLVFAKDGSPAWSEPLRWCWLRVPCENDSGVR